MLDFNSPSNSSSLGRFESLLIVVHQDDEMSLFSEAPVRTHLKNVYVYLTMSVLAATAGAYLHMGRESPLLPLLL